MKAVTEEMERDLQECVDLISGWDPLIHQKSRLAMLLLMYQHDISKFTELRDITGLSAQNLSNHLGKLEAAEWVTIEKYFEGKKPTTAVYLTELGIEKIRGYFVQITAG